MMNDVLSLSIRELGRLYREHELSPVEVMTKTLARLDEREPVLNAFISVYREESLLAAAEAEKVLKETDQKLSPLFGVPITVKDLFYTKGKLTTCGSKILGEFIPDYDATVVERLRSSGAILFGKTNMLEFAYGVPHPDYGQTNNPWDPERTSGGSSGGSAAAVAEYIGYASLGTDTGGSIRIPASYCGVVGLKPTYGFVSTYGVFPLSASLDHVGPIARSIDDVSCVLDVITGFDPLDPYADPKANQNASSSYADTRNRASIGKRVGVLPTRDLRYVEKEVLTIYRNAINTLEKKGYELIETDLGDLREMESHLLKILAPEASVIHRRWFDRGQDYAEHTYRQIVDGHNVSAVDYLLSKKAQQTFRDRLNGVFNDISAVLTPTVSFPALSEDPLIDDEKHDELMFTGPFNFSGHPAITLNGGRTREGLPIGLQFVGTYYGESQLLKIAWEFESSP